MSSALANDCSLPRGASRVSLSTEPSRKRISTRTLCREPAPSAVMAGSCTTFTLRESFMRAASSTQSAVNSSTNTSPSIKSVATQNGRLSCAEVRPSGRYGQPT